MAPLRPSKTGGHPRRPNLPRRTPLAQAPLESPSPAAAAAPAVAAAAVATPAAQATPGYSTWLPMPRTFVSSSSTPMVQTSDLSASDFSVHEERKLKVSFQIFGML